MDLRDLTICSVDPPGCTDIDDALHARELGNGLYEMGVHIADVSHFVKPGSALDLEAASRGTTVYLADQRIDMIPGALSSNLCSLVEGKERLTFSVIWTIDPKTAEIKDTKFGKSVICSKGALEYEEAQNMIDSKRSDELACGLRRLMSVAKVLRKNRIANGALILASGGEVRFMEVESETHDDPNALPTKEKQLVKKKVVDTMSMIEEFMLLANVSVAQKIFEDFPELALLRKHPPVSEKLCQDLLAAAKAKGIELDVSSGKKFNESLDRARDENNEYFNTMLRMIATRCMTRAEYVCSGVEGGDPNSYSHYGIGASIYTHFTSPIRRYADLMVHRLLAFSVEASNLDSSLLDKHKIGNIAFNCNFRHENAKNASRASTKFHTLQYVKSRGSLMEEDAYLFEVLRNGFTVFIPKLALDMNYRIREAELWDFDEVTLTQTYLPLKRKLSQFDPIKIQLGVVDRSTEYRRGNESVEVLIVEPPVDKRRKV